MFYTWHYVVGYQQPNSTHFIICGCIAMNNTHQSPTIAYTYMYINYQGRYMNRTRELFLRQFMCVANNGPPNVLLTCPNQQQ